MLGGDDRETPEERQKRVLEASYDALSSFDKFRLEVDLRLMSRVYDMDTHKWFYGLHDDVLTKDLHGKTKKAFGDATGRARSIYGSMSVGVKALVILAVSILFFMVVPAFFAAVRNRREAEDLRLLLSRSLFAVVAGLLIRWGYYWFVKGFWAG